MLKTLWEAWNRAVNALNQFAATLETATAKLDQQAHEVREALPDAEKALPEPNANGSKRHKARV